MNNQQFRRLVLDTPTTSTSNKASSRAEPPKQDAGSARGQALGSRMRSSIPMTPRSVTPIDFSRQLAEHRQSQQSTKRFKSSAAPKGTRLPSGYQDRAALLRQGDDEGTDVEKRVRALEEMVQLGQIDRDMFERLRTEIGVGGDLKSTHMVKGLDWELLRRVKAGEDVERPRPPADEGEGDVDGEFERVLEEKGRAVLPSAPREKEKKKGVMAAPPLPALRKSRDEILREWKASRAATTATATTATATSHPTEPALGGKFKRIGETKVEKKRFIELDEDGRRREVLLITDAEGKTKRKVRYLDPPGKSNGANGLLVPDKDAKPLGMEVPAEIAAKAAVSTQDDDDDDDIFGGVGDDYNPLGEGEEDDTTSSDEDEGEVPAQAPEKVTVTETEKPTVEPLPRPRNYFTTSTKDEPEEPDHRVNPLTNDPTLLAALKKAAALRQASPSEAGAGDGEEDVDAETLLRRKKFLEEARRREALDAMDMDYGFGGSRIEDDEDDEVVFEEGGGRKRKRGPKKKKGDKNSATDVLRVLEGRKTG